MRFRTTTELMLEEALAERDAARADAEALRVRRDELLRIAGENRADAERWKDIAAALARSARHYMPWLSALEDYDEALAAREAR